MTEMVKGLEKLELLVVADPHPTTFRRDLGAQEWHLSAASLHAVRDLWLAHRVQPFAAVGRAGRQADLRSRRTITRSSNRLSAKLGFAESDVQEHQGGRQSSIIRRPAA